MACILKNYTDFFDAKKATSASSSADPARFALEIQTTRSSLESKPFAPAASTSTRAAPTAVVVVDLDLGTPRANRGFWRRADLPSHEQSRKMALQGALRWWKEDLRAQSSSPGLVGGDGLVSFPFPSRTQPISELTFELPQQRLLAHLGSPAIRGRRPHRHLQGAALFDLASDARYARFPRGGRRYRDDLRAGP